MLDTRRNSSTPAMGRPIVYPFEIPEIRRISASTATEASLPSTHSCLEETDFNAQGHKSQFFQRTYALAQLSPVLSPNRNLCTGINGIIPTGSSQQKYLESKARLHIPLGEIRPPIAAAGRCETYNGSRGRESPEATGGEDADDLSSDSGSDDSMYIERKRKLVFNLRGSLEEFSQRMRERTGEPAAMGRNTNGLR